MIHDARMGPPSVSEVLRKEFLRGKEITQDRLAVALGVSRHSVNELLNGRRSVTALMALRLAQVLGPDPRFWLNLQAERDLFEASTIHAAELAVLEPLVARHEEAEVVKSYDELFGNDDA